MTQADETEPTVLFIKQDAVAHVVLNRPRVINAYNVQMRDDLFQALEAVRDDPEVRVAIVRGAGDRGFCAGADLTEFGTAPSQVIARRVRFERDVWKLFADLQKPLIAALHGYVIGSGVEIACLCDIRIAARNSIFQMPEVALGMVPAAGGTQTLPRVMGMGHAMELVLTNKRIDSEEALRLGLVHRVVPEEDLLPQAENLARTLASLDPKVLAAAKSAVVQGMDLPAHDGLQLERRLASGLIQQATT